MAMDVVYRCPTGPQTDLAYCWINQPGQLDLPGRGQGVQLSGLLVSQAGARGRSLRGAPAGVYRSMCTRRARPVLPGWRRLLHVLRPKAALMGAPIGAVVRIAPYDWRSDQAPPGPGDFLRSNGGSLYQILARRRVRRAYGRYALTCLKVTAFDMPADARVAELWWYPRRSSNSRSARVLVSEARHDPT